MVVPFDILLRLLSLPIEVVVVVDEVVFTSFTDMGVLPRSEVTTEVVLVVLEVVFIEVVASRLVHEFDAV